MNLDYSELSPDTVINAIESKGFLSDCRVLPLNSYENRVYQIGIEDAQPIVAKFYRPNRWSDEQILEEHQFSSELHELDIPAVPPIYLDSANSSSTESLFYYQGFRFLSNNRIFL